MRRIKLIHLTLFLLPLMTVAQTKFGLQAGPQLSYRTGFPSDLNLKTKALFSFQAGAFLQHPMSNSLSLRPLLALSNKGVVFKDIHITDNLGNDIGTADVHARISYLELLVPVLIQLNSTSSVNFQAGAGPWLAYALSGKNVYNNFEGTGTPPSSEIDMDNIKRIDIGATVQFLVEFAKHWQAGLQFNPAFNDMSEGGGFENKNNSFVLSLGYILR